MNSRWANALRTAWRSPDAWGVRSGPRCSLVGAIETRADPAAYRWDNARRPLAAGTRAVLVQWTIDGRGAWRGNAPARTHAVGPGRAFVAVLPSPTGYWLPEDAGPWTFAWAILEHPYVAERVAEGLAADDRPVDVGADAPLRRATLDLLARCWDARAAAPPIEPFLFAWLFAWEDARRAPADAGAELARRAEVLLARSRDGTVGVKELAAADGRSRTAYTHRFTRLVGESPARFLRARRLDEAARLLETTADTVAAIAARTGFADARHLARAFRERFHGTPAEFRSRLRRPPVVSTSARPSHGRRRASSET